MIQALLATPPQLGAGLLTTASAQQAQPVLSVHPVTVTEGDAATTTAHVLVELSHESAQTVEVDYSTLGMSARADLDFEPQTGRLFFQPGETGRLVEIQIVGDTIEESAEQFRLLLSNATNASIAVHSDPPTVNILDNDPNQVPQPGMTVVEFSAATFVIEEGAGTAAVVVKRTGADLNTASSVDYETRNDSASDRSDYSAAYGRLDFAPGESSKEIKIFITDDRFNAGVPGDPYSEQVSRFTVLLTNPANAALGAQASTEVSILDNDGVTDGRSPVKDSAFDAEFFVRQHYRDFLNRDPDPEGLVHWVGQTTGCGAADVQVCRINVSAAFFLSIEFQQTGYFVYLLHKVAFNSGERLRLRDFLRGAQAVGEGVSVGKPGWEETLEANKRALLSEFVASAPFKARYPAESSPAAFVNTLDANSAGLFTLAEREVMIAELSDNNTDEGRAAVLSKFVENNRLRERLKNQAFVLMQYFSYLRRNPSDVGFNGQPDPDFRGYHFWLQKLIDHNGNFVNAEMIKAFITSIEYEQRFGE